MAALLLLMTLAVAATADEAAVRRLIASRVGAEARIEQIERVPGSSLYEVTIRGANGPQLFYVDERASSSSARCSPDRARAWNDLMLRDIEPTASPDCPTPVEKLVALGRQLGANSTPTWFVETGERYSGAMALEDTRRILNAAARARP